MMKESYFLSIVLNCTTGEWIYRLAKGYHVRSARVLCDISRRGAQKWFAENKRRCVHVSVRANFFPDEDTNKIRVFFVNRAFQFYDNNS